MPEAGNTASGSSDDFNQTLSTLKSAESEGYAQYSKALEGGKAAVSAAREKVEELRLKARIDARKLRESILSKRAKEIDALASKIREDAREQAERILKTKHPPALADELVGVVVGDV